MKNLKFESEITSFDCINPLFSKIKMRICYTGLNRNNSFLTKEVIEKALPTIYNTPIVGEYRESLDDFRGHGGKIEISDDGIKWINTTVPYGVIDSQSEIIWENVVEKNGEVKTYLTATGYLWTGRYPELKCVIEDSKSQSMEIEVTQGSFEEMDGQKVYKVTDFVFSAFCILGDDIEPAFESANIKAYQFDKDKFKFQFSELISELKNSLQYSTIEERSIEMEDVLEVIEYADEQTTEISDYEENSVKVEIVVSDNEESSNESDRADEEMQKDISKEYNNEQKQIDEDSTQSELYKKEIEMLKKEIESLKLQLEVQQQDFQSLLSQYQFLEQYKLEKEHIELQNAYQELYSRFSDNLTQDELAQIKSLPLSLQDVEKEIYALIGKKFASKVEKAKPIKFQIDTFIETKKNDKVYADLIEKFKK